MNKEVETLEERLHDLNYVLSCKEIDELRNLCYEHSNSWCPLSSFFNDIDLNESETYNEKNQAFKDLWLIALIVLDKKKELKALEIIKEKNVDIVWLTFCKTLEEYNANHLHQLTQEEFVLLKEVLL